MRTRILSTILAVALLAGCGGDDSTGPSDDDNHTVTGPIRTLSMSVNGTQMSAGTISGTWYNGQFTLGGAFGAAGALAINANNFPGPGTYSLGPGNPSTAIAQWVDGTTGSYSSLLLDGSGTLTLTIAELGHMKGTFSFIGKAQNGTGGPVLTVNITNGAFEIKLQ